MMISFRPFRISSFLVLCLFSFSVFGKTKGEFTVLQWNIWQEGTMVAGGYDAIVNEIMRLQPDFVTLSEVRNYKGVDFGKRLCASLKEKGLIYYGFRSDDTGLLSRYPISDSATVFPLKNDHGSIYKLISEINGVPVAIYTAHLDYLNDAYYDVRGYDGSTWREIPVPTSEEEVLRRNLLSQRDEAITAFLAEAKKDLAAGRLVVIGGDFNEPSHRDWTKKTKDLYDHHGLVVAWTQTTALEQAGFKDAYRTIYPDPLTHPGFTFPASNPDVAVNKLTWAPKSDERERIDYLFFAGKGLKVTSCQVFGPAEDIAYSKRVSYVGKDAILTPQGMWPTDHKGVLATFSYKR